VGGELPGRHADLATNPATGASAGPETTRARSRVGAQGTYTHAAKVTGNVCRASRSGVSPIRESPTCSARWYAPATFDDIFEESCCGARGRSAARAHAPGTPRVGACAQRTSRPSELERERERSCASGSPSNPVARPRLPRGAQSVSLCAGAAGHRRRCRGGRRGGRAGGGMGAARLCAENRRGGSCVASADGARRNACLSSPSSPSEPPSPSEPSSSASCGPGRSISSRHATQRLGTCSIERLETVPAGPRERASDQLRA